MGKLRDRLSYANVTATLALFVALGGTSYAVIELPRNSVGSQQIRSRAVGQSELDRSAVSSKAVRDRSLALRDLSLSARGALRGAAGPQGPKGDPGPTGVVYSAAINSAGGRERGNATAFRSLAEGQFLVEWAVDVAGCQAVATLAAVPNGPVIDPPAGRITVRPNGRGIEVRTFDVDGTGKSLPFNILISC